MSLALIRPMWFTGNKTESVGSGEGGGDGYRRGGDYVVVWFILTFPLPALNRWLRGLDVLHCFDIIWISEKSSPFPHWVHVWGRCGVGKEQLWEDVRVEWVEAGFTLISFPLQTPNRWLRRLDVVHCFDIIWVSEKRFIIAHCPPFPHCVHVWGRGGVGKEQLWEDLRVKGV